MKRAQGQVWGDLVLPLAAQFGQVVGSRAVQTDESIFIPASAGVP